MQSLGGEDDRNVVHMEEELGCLVIEVDFGVFVCGWVVDECCKELVECVFEEFG
jgi:hypothetical protein